MHMSREKLCALLEAYPPTPEEENFKREILSFVRDHPNCFERSLSFFHMSASACLLNRDETKALLLHHAKLNIWVQPGGHCDGESDVLAVAIKEAQEESGILGIAPLSQSIFDIDIHKIPTHKEIPEHFHYDIRFLLKVTSDELLVQNSESNELRWINKDTHDLPPLDRSTLRLFNKWNKM